MIIYAILSTLEEKKYTLTGFVFLLQPFKKHMYVPICGTRFNVKITIFHVLSDRKHHAKQVSHSIILNVYKIKIALEESS